MSRVITAILFLVLLIPVLAPDTATPARVHAQAGIQWSVEYFNNPYLTGSPVLTRSEIGREFYWGGGSPSTSVPADNFSARFASDPAFSAGTYRFYILADDGIKLWLDFPPDLKPTLNTYDAPQPSQLLTADVTLSAGSHHVQVDYRENTGDAYLYIGWESLADGAQGPGFSTPPLTVNWGVQWTVQYFGNPTLTGSPVLSQSESSPNHDWGAASPGSGVPADTFSARWILYQNFDAGNYTIDVKADDGVRVNVDGRTIIDQWHGATGQTYTGTVALGAGSHSVVVEYYEATGNAYLTVHMVKEGTSGGTTPPPASPTGATATITAYRLNVRSAPISGSILTKVSRGEVYSVLGRNSSNSWWQINANGVIGWVSGLYVTVANAQLVPVVGATTPATPTPAPNTYGQCPGFMPSRLSPGKWGRVTPGLPNNLRMQPGYYAASLGQIPAGGVFQVLGGPVCADSTAWFQVNYLGTVGWTAEGQSTTYWLEPNP